MKRLDETLAGEHEHHLFPFFWQRGEGADTISQYMQEMYGQGLRGLCVESRPHPDFCGDGWWADMDAIVDEAKRLGMELWILDDVSFPTGSANHKVPDHLKKRYLACHRYDFEGDGVAKTLNVAFPAGMRAMRDQRHLQDSTVACVLARREPSIGEAFDEGDLTDLTGKVVEGTLTLPPVVGPHSVFVVYETACGAEEATRDHLDPMRAEATQVLIDEVYEPHYARYASEFGRTIKAFFSDEPRFGNGPGRGEIVGHTDSPLPWNAEVSSALEERGVSRAELALLFAGSSAHVGEVRFAYMDVVSDLYSRNFSQVLGSWCHKHGVAYVGHVIEDDNAHARLAQGPGHYFRAMAGEDVAGIDVIGGQVVPGMDYHHDAFSTGGSDGEFYHYALARMAASCAKLDPRKQGRVMCEAFGAYGWTEGLRMMGWIGDHLLAHGVNLFVPHAFSMAPFPDFDCPPHFYAHGNNPQWPEFHQWALRADRLCHLLSGGHRVASVGVLYHAFAEWSGGSQYFQKACKALQQAQVDSDVISEDWLMGAEVRDGHYVINGFAYGCLVVPEATRLPAELAARLSELAAAGVDVVFLGNRPHGCSGGRTVCLDELACSVERYCDLHIQEVEPHLSFEHYVHEDGEVWFFFNEDIAHAIDVEVDLSTNAPLAEYDAHENRLWALAAKSGRFHLHLEPYESLCVVTAECSERRPVAGEAVATIADAFLSLRPYDSDDYDEAHVVSLMESHVPAQFSGSMRYEFDFEAETHNLLLRLPKVWETSRVTVNGTFVGESTLPCPTFDISSAVRKGTNRVAVEVTNTLVHVQRDLFSMYLPIDPSGIEGPATINRKV